LNPALSTKRLSPGGFMFKPARFASVHVVFSRIYPCLSLIQALNQKSNPKHGFQRGEEAYYLLAENYCKKQVARLAN
jgi:hypothetical protein